MKFKSGSSLVCISERRYTHRLNDLLEKRDLHHEVYESSEKELNVKQVTVSRFEKVLTINGKYIIIEIYLFNTDLYFRVEFRLQFVFLE